jgi:hypothetical protein
MALPPAPYALARFVTVLITVAVWFCLLLVMGFIFSGGASVKHVSPEVMANVAAMVFVFIPFFSAQGVLTGMMDGLLQQRIVLHATPDVALRSRNPWSVAAVLALCVGLPCAVVGHVLASGAALDTFTPGAFALKLASYGVLPCALTAWIVSGRPFLHETRVSQEHRRYDGDAMRYVWVRHVWPNALVNAVINFAVAYALTPGDLNDAQSLAPIELVVGDTLVTFLVLSALITGGVATHARVDRAWGIAPGLPSEGAGGMRRVILPKLLAGVAFTVFVGLGLWLTKQRAVAALPWAIYRGVVFGFYAGWVARDVALAKLREPA